MAKPKATSKPDAKKPAAPKEEYDNTNRGVLFTNEKKAGKTHPDFKGSFTDSEGHEFWLSGWKKVSKDGSKKFISISAQPKEEASEEGEEETKDSAW